jgi:hypothetical protein
MSDTPTPTPSSKPAGCQQEPCSAFAQWCQNLGWQVIKTAMEAMEKDVKPSNKDLADIIRNACSDYAADRVALDMQNVNVMAAPPEPQ